MAKPQSSNRGVGFPAKTMSGLKKLTPEQKAMLIDLISETIRLKKQTEKVREDNKVLLTI